MDEKYLLSLIEEGKTTEEYLDNYCNLVDNALKRGLTKSTLFGYFEIHHIQPKCLEGEDKSYNYVLLSPEEHVIAHVLLCKIYPNNIKLLRSVQIISKYVNSNYNNNILGIENIENIISNINSIKSNLLSLLVKPVVCFLKDFTVIKIYKNGVLSTKEDGFAYKNIGTVLSGKGNHIRKTVGGYRWMELDKFEQLHSDKITEYYSKLKTGNSPELGNIKELVKKAMTEQNPVNRKRIICYNEDGCIIKIYNSITDTVKDGFSNSILSAIINKKTKNNYHWGYYWSLIDDYLKTFPDKKPDLETFMNNLSVQIIPIKEDNRIICCDINKNILKVYNLLKETIKDGICHTSLCKILNNGEHEFRGYFWYKVEDWEDLESLNNYYLSNSNQNKKLKLKRLSNDPLVVVQCKKDGTILNIFNNLHTADKCTGISYKKISEEVNGKHLKEKEFYWYKLSDYIEKFSIKKLNEFIWDLLEKS